MKSKKIIIIISLIVIIFFGGVLALNTKKTKNIVKYNISSNNSGTITQNSGSESNSGLVNQEPNSIGPLAYINSFDGDVTKNYLGKIENVSNSMTIKEQDKITTKEGTVEIIFADNSIVRLNKNTTLSFSVLNRENTETYLEDGEIWARILKPLTDSSFFTIKTSDASAGVRGTSLVLKKTKIGTDVKVIDSYSPNNKKTGILLTYFHKKLNRKIEQTLDMESSVMIDLTKDEIIKTPLKNTEIFNNEFIRDNTQRDIIYMDNIKEKFKDRKDIYDKINGELGVSLPKKDEMKTFFKEEILRKNAELALGGSGQFNPESLIKNIKNEVDINGDRRFLDNSRFRLNGQISQEEKIRLEELIKKRQEELDNKFIQLGIPLVGTGSSPEIKKLPINQDKVPVSNIVPLDSDKDGIPNIRDNCPMISNPFQKDSNNNGKGDACDIIEVKPINEPKPIIQPEPKPIPVLPRKIISGEAIIK